jgi:hypothetical protein
MKNLLRLGLAALALAGAPLAQAWTYADGDALLIFHKSGYNDVEFDLGNISQFSSQASGYSAPVNNWDLGLVTSTYGADLTGVKAVVVATTSSSDPNRTAWLTSAGTGATVSDFTSSQWQTLLYSTIDGIGTKPAVYGATNNGSKYSLAPTFLGSYEYVVAGSASGINQTTLPFFGGRTSFAVEQAAPGTFQFWAIQPSTINPKPAANLVGYFTLSTNGLLDFSVGSAVAVPTLSTLPVNQTNNAGTTATFAVAASGGALSYQWQKNGTNLTDVGNVSGSTNATLTLSNVQDSDAATYGVVVVNAAGSNTASATLTVIDPPVITTEPANITQNAGSTGTFTVAYTGTAPSFQWYKGATPLADGGNVSGSVTATLILTDVQVADAASYNLVLSNAAGSVTSSVVSLTVNDPFITVQPQPAAVVVAGTASFTVTAGGGSTLHYQWLSNNVVIAGATGATLTIPNVKSTFNNNLYKVVVSDANSSVTSTTAKLTVVAKAVTVGTVANKTVYAGQPVTFSTTVSGGEAPTYQWYSPTGAVAGATALSYTIAAANFSDAGSYYVAVSDATLGSPIEKTSTLTVNVPEKISNPAAATTVKQGQLFTLKTVVSNNTKLPYVNTFQWYSNSVVIPGATFATYTNSTDSTNGSAPTVIDYTVQVGYSYDAISGNLASAPGVVTVVADTNLPTVTFVNPANKAQLTNNTQVINSAYTVTGKATDNAHVSQVFVSLNGGAYQPANVTNNPTATSVTWGLLVNPVVGTNNVAAYSVDFAGNLSKTNTLSFFFAVPGTVTVSIVGDGTVGSTNLFDSVTASTLIGTNQFFVGRSYTLTATAANNNLFSNWVDSTDNTISNTGKFTFTVKTQLDLTANFVANRFLAFKGTYYGLFSDTNNGVTESNAGWFTATVTPSNTKQSFSASLFVDGDALSGITGTFDLNGNGTATKQVARKGKAPLTVAFQLNFDDTIAGTIIDSSDNWTSTASGDLNTYSITNHSPYAGTYNLLVPGFANAADGPAGYSYLTLKIAAAGTVTASGSLADGQAISGIQAAGSSTNGDVPVYAKAYSYGFVTPSNTIASYAGSLLGWLNFNGSTPSGSLFWLKTAAATNAYYSGGFSNETAVVGSAYNSAPVTPVGGFLITNGLVTLSGGDLAGDITDNVSVSNAVVKILGSDSQLKTLTFAPATGLVGGSFTNTATHTVETLKGLYLNLPGANNIIGGWFLGPDQGGSLLVQPQ